ncbi:MAG: hypothetical protein WC575_04810 [Patescibacteria group bacterium]
MEIDDQRFNLVRKRAEEEYEKIGKVKCPYLNDYVNFNTIGFQHLLFKDWNKTRLRTEQYIRLKLIKLAPLVISKSHTLQEFDECKIFIRQKINSRWESRIKIVRYYVFVAIINEARIKVIVKGIEGGGKIFYSLYPSWKVVVDVNGQKKKKFYSGDLESD